MLPIIATKKVLNKTHSLLLVISSIIGANVTSYFTLEQNLSAGVYPTDADSIGLPLMEGAFISIQVLVLLCVAIFIPKRKILGPAIGAFLCILATLLSGALSISWSTPYHYAMATAYGLVLIVCCILTTSYIRRLTSNIAAKKVVRTNNAHTST